MQLLWTDVSNDPDLKSHTVDLLGLAHLGLGPVVVGAAVVDIVSVCV